MNTKAINFYENKELYESVNNVLKKINKSSLIETMKSADIIYKQKDNPKNIKDILNYMNVYLYNSNNVGCIQYVEDTKRRLNQNANYDMTIDYLLIRIWEEINEKHSRGTV